MFSHYPQRYSSSPFDSYYVDPYRAAAIQRQRQLELEAARREQERLLRAQRLRQLRAQQEEAQRLERILSQRYRQKYGQPDEEEEDDAEEQEPEQYYHHPFFPFGFAPQPQPQRRQPSPPVQHPPRRQSPPQQQVSLPSSEPSLDLSTNSTNIQQRRRPASPQSIHIPINEEVHASASPQREVSIPVDALPFPPSSNPSPSPQSQSHSVPINVPSRPSLSEEELEDRRAAALVIQSHWRAHQLRHRALAQISSIRDAFTVLQTNFTFPSTVDFVSSPSPSSANTDTVPALAYTPSNRAILAYEHSATELLTRLDAVDSAGDRKVRRARKALVDEIERAMRGVENAKGEAWRRVCEAAAAAEAQQQMVVGSEVQEAVEEDASAPAQPTESLTTDVEFAESQSQSEPTTSTPTSASVATRIVIDPTPTFTTSSSTTTDADADIELVDKAEAEADNDDDEWVDASDEAWIDQLQDQEDEKDVEMQLDTVTAPLPRSVGAVVAGEGLERDQI